MPDNLIRIKQIDRAELSGYILSVSSGERGVTGPVGAIGSIGPIGPTGSAAGASGQFQYKSGSVFAAANVYYESNQVGVNTAFPAFDLDVQGDDGIRTSATGTSAKGQLEHEAGGTSLRLYNDGGSSKVRIGSSGSSFFMGGRIGVGTTTPSYTHHVNGSGYYNSGLGFASTYIPTNSGSNGVSGQMTYDTGFFYICIANNTWRRAAVSTF